MDAKESMRASLAARYESLWPGSAEPGRAPVFPGAGKAAERLRKQGEYRLARSVAVMPDPALLQVRINLMADKKLMLAATPGLKQGLVRITPQAVPFARRSKDLRGWSLAKAGKPLHPPLDQVGKVDMLVGAAMAVGENGVILGDGRGLLDLAWLLLKKLGALQDKTPVAVLVDDEQVVDQAPREDWDLATDLIVTPSRVIRVAKPARPQAGLDNLPARLASLPLVKVVLGG